MWTARFLLSYVASKVGRKSSASCVFSSGVPETDRTIPSVYPLKSYKPEAGFPDTVCLVTDFPSPNKTLAVDDKDLKLNDIAVLHKSSDDKWRYSTVVWDWNNPTEKPSCTVEYDGATVSPENIADETADTCISLTVRDNYQTNPGMNTLSTSVLGLRIVTAKAIVFNLIITMRLWSS